MAITHILWDNDGVLVDTEKLYFEACRRTLAEVDIDLTAALFAEYSLTRGVSVFELAVERRAVARDDLPRHHARRDDVWAELLERHRCLMAGAEEVVGELFERCVMGVVTGAKRRHFTLTHRGTRLPEWLSFDYAREDYVRSKPYPDPYQTALLEQKLDPERCLVVEDSPRGLASARAAGLRCVVIPNPLAADADWSEAAAVLERLDQLPAWVRDNG